MLELEPSIKDNSPYLERFNKCLGLLNEYLELGGYPIQTENCSVSINEDVIEFFKYEGKEFIDISNFDGSIGGLLESMLIQSDGEVFEIEGRRFKIGYECGNFSERLFHIENIKSQK